MYNQRHHDYIFAVYISLNSDRQVPAKEQSGTVVTHHLKKYGESVTNWLRRTYPPALYRKKTMASDYIQFSSHETLLESQPPSFFWRKSDCACGGHFTADDGDLRSFLSPHQ